MDSRGQRVTINNTPALYIGPTNLYLQFNMMEYTIKACGYIICLNVNPSFRLAIQVNHGLLKHCVEGMRVEISGTSVVHATKEGTEPFIMFRFIICGCPLLGILQVYLTPRARVFVSDTDDIFSVRTQPHRVV